MLLWILVILVVLLVLFGGGGYRRRRAWRGYYGAGMSLLGFLLIVLLVLWLLGFVHG